MSLYGDFVGFKNVEPSKVQTEVGLGLEVTKVKGYQSAKKNLAKIEQLPNSTTEDAVFASAIQANTILANNAKLSRLARNRLKLARGITQSLTIQQNYQTGMMDLDQKMQEGNAAFGIKQATYNLDTTVTQIGYSSYIDELTSDKSQVANQLSGW